MNMKPSMEQTSKIEQLIEEIEDFIHGCKSKMFSSTEIVVNREEMEELLQELRRSTPEEIKRCQKVISQYEAIINDARSKANKLIQDATIQTNELISEHQIMQQAYQQANEVVSMATGQAQEILNKATLEANGMRDAAVQYMDQMLTYFENLAKNTNQAAAANYESLFQSLTQVQDTIEANRRELHPELYEQPAEESGSGKEGKAE